jgi:hypothetical protein
LGFSYRFQAIAEGARRRASSAVNIVLVGQARTKRAHRERLESEDTSNGETWGDDRALVAELFLVTL